jgi:hypothetical protein
MVFKWEKLVELVELVGMGEQKKDPVLRQQGLELF